MPTKYLEIKEISDKESGVLKTTRVEVVDMDDALDKLPALEATYEGKTYKKRLHICNHDIGQPCTAVVME